MRPYLLLLVPVLAAALAVAAPGHASSAGGQIQVVAAENFWGSIAGQLGGDRVHVTSIISNPATDPHDYEPNAVDARTIAGAKMMIVNGIGYDPWASKLLAANPVGGRVVLTVGDLVGIKTGGNPHRWYSPLNVQKVITAITADYAKLDPNDAAYFRAQKAAFEKHGLAQYKAVIATIKRRYHGVAVGASESIFAPLAQAVGLKLITPSSFLKAISEGTEPTAADKTTIDRQIAKKQIKVWVFNSQNSTPDVARLTEAARKQHIPVTTITETLTPASASFQQWQVRQLRALASALHAATGK
ncbi:MAG: metal ABC transporter solute-binding protein, Zn/Mn family [Gaiellaceae bacterium]